MANSITLSQSLVDDIAQKLTDGTATAEQVVLYTKGLNQLQTGNDFQSVVIGLSQSAVDAIDSANAQFQEDVQAALNTFSQTSTNIDTSATNAVSAINTAKDTLVATDAEITSTINNLPNQDAITRIVEDTKRNIFSETMPHWDGVHDLPRFFKGYGMTESEGFKDLIHPYDAPAYLEYIEMNTTSGFWRLKNHKHEVMDEIPVLYTATSYDTANNTAYIYGDKTVHYGYYDLNSSHNYWFVDINDNPGSSSGQWPAMTSIFGPNGQSRYMQSGFAWRGMRPGFVRTSNETGGNENRTSSMFAAVIVGTSKKDFCINRPSSNHEVYFSSSMNPQFAQNSYNNRPEWEQKLDRAGTRDGELNQSDLYDWNGTTNTGGSSTIGDFLYHERLSFNSFTAAGYGNMSYNMNTNKFLYIDINSSSPYPRKPKLMTVDPTFNLRDVSLGKTGTGADNYDPVASGKMTVEIDANLDLRAEADAITSRARVNDYDEHGGQAVLCDNDTVVNVWAYTTGTNILRAVRAVKNGTNTDYTFDQKWDRTLQAYQQDTSYYGVTNVVTNDGRYAVIYTHDYYYGGGINGFIVRVADGALLQFEYHNSGSGMHLIPLKHEIIGFYRNRSSSWKFDVSMDYLFATYSDGDDVSSEIITGTQYRENWFSKAENHYDLRRRRTNIQFNIYNPYNYLMEYYNADGTRKSQYDKNLNLIT